MGQSEARRLLDFDQPIGLLMLHWVPEEVDPLGLRPGTGPRRRRAVSGDHPGHRGHQGHQGESLTGATDVIKRSESPDQVNSRSHAEVVRLFEGSDPAEPGVVRCDEWHPAGPAEIASEPGMNTLVCAKVGRMS
ncbi:SAM-dependent methyltransferase [Saccharothrix isguenensis]